MLMLRDNPSTAYRRVAVDARIRGAGPRDLVMLCYDQLGAELGKALRAHATGDARRRSDGLTRAYAALAALEMGLDRTNPVAGALEQIYAAARETILSSVTSFDAASLQAVRDDFAEIGSALASAPSAPAAIAQ